ncbi:hypothetical protein [Planococcus sp. ISL-109]|uniref:hypothetical protein n=1 Tax=Planococcus sp. ISL-109 TaxID=2819166 RepID=UPI001BE89065|nr:hypothetical protein [Planococcus sp. ISL-109]MBT2583870.1 hypothetical protein [Planococcus sp. ISL-109]
MKKMEQLPQQSVGYYFFRSKDVHVENGSAFITFFVRLTRETSFRKEGKVQTQVQSVWVDIDEVMFGHASEKVRALPDCMQRYELTQSVFYNLYELSNSCPEELFCITPYHRKSTRKKFIT